MTDHSGLLDRYRRMRDVRFRLNHLLVKTIPKKTLEECGRILGFFRKGKLFFDTEDETALLMDYCLYYPQPDGRNLITRYLEKSPPPPGSDEMAALQEMTHAYYSLLRVLGVERGVGVSVQDLLQGETGFIVDVGFGNTARRHMMVATRIIPTEDFLMTGGAALPADASAAERISKEMMRTGYNPEALDFKRITPRQEAEVAALIIVPVGPQGCPPTSPMRSRRVMPAPRPSVRKPGASVATTLARAGAGRSSRRAAVEIRLDPVESACGIRSPDFRCPRHA